MTAKQPTPQGISALLKRAGVRQPRKTRGGVEPPNADGFRTSLCTADGSVHVDWDGGSWFTRKHALENCAKVIAAAGYAVEVTTYAGAPDVMHLTVTAVKEQDQ